MNKHLSLPLRAGECPPVATAVSVWKHAPAQPLSWFEHALVLSPPHFWLPHDFI